MASKCSFLVTRKINPHVRARQLHAEESVASRCCLENTNKSFTMNDALRSDGENAVLHVDCNVPLLPKLLEAKAGGQTVVTQPDVLGTFYSGCRGPQLPDGG